MTAAELIDIVKHGLNGLEDPNDIFKLHAELQNMDEVERIKFRQNRNSEALGMSYITAVEMKKKDTWDKYVEERRREGRKSAEEIKEELRHMLNLGKEDINGEY